MRPSRGLFRSKTPEHRREIRELRALQMINLQLRGRTLKEIGEEFRLHPRNVNKEINWARREEVWETARETALGLGIKALKVYDKALEVALESGDIEAARDIVFGLGILKKDGKSPTTKDEVAPNGTTVTLQQWREMRSVSISAAKDVAPKRIEATDVAPTAFIEAVVFEEDATSSAEDSIKDAPFEVVPISQRYSGGG